MRRFSSRFDVVSELATLRRYALSLADNTEDAEDLVHDTLVRAYERRASYDFNRTLRPWLLSIMHNLFIDRSRTRRAEAKREIQVAELTDIHSGPEQDHHVRLAQIGHAFMNLPVDQRATLHLVAIEGLSYDDAASALGVPVGTLMSRLSRARAALRALELGVRSKLHTASHLKVVGGDDDASP